MSSSSCLCVMCGSAPLSGLDTVAAQLQECEASSQVSTSVSILPTFVIIQLRSLYSHQLQRRSPPRPLLSRQRAGKGCKKKHLKQLFNRTGKTHLCVGFISFHSRWMCWISDTAVRNQPVSHYVSLRALVCDPAGVNKSILWHNKRSWFRRSMQQTCVNVLHESTQTSDAFAITSDTGFMRYTYIGYRQALTCC